MQFEFRMRVQPEALTAPVRLDLWVVADGCNAGFAGELVVLGTSAPATAGILCRRLQQRFLLLLAVRTGTPVRAGAATLTTLVGGRPLVRGWPPVRRPVPCPPGLDPWHEEIPWALACLPWAGLPAVAAFLRRYQAAAAADSPAQEAARLRQALAAAGVAAPAGWDPLRLRLAACQLLLDLPAWAPRLASGSAAALP